MVVREKYHEDGVLKETGSYTIKGIWDLIHVWNVVLGGGGEEGQLIHRNDFPLVRELKKSKNGGWHT